MKTIELTEDEHETVRLILLAEKQRIISKADRTTNYSKKDELYDIADEVAALTRKFA
jgi:hypothetical protein